jgi:hypothetical protein
VSDARIRAAKPKGGPYMLFDSQGLSSEGLNVRRSERRTMIQAWATT